MPPELKRRPKYLHKLLKISYMKNMMGMSVYPHLFTWQQIRWLWTDDKYYHDFLLTNGPSHELMWWYDISHLVKQNTHLLIGSPNFQWSAAFGALTEIGCWLWCKNHSTSCSLGAESGLMAIHLIKTHAVVHIWVVCYAYHTDIIMYNDGNLLATHNIFLSIALNYYCIILQIGRRNWVEIVEYFKISSLSN